MNIVAGNTAHKVVVHIFYNTLRDKSLGVHVNLSREGEGENVASEDRSIGIQLEVVRVDGAIGRVVSAHDKVCDVASDRRCHILVVTNVYLAHTVSVIGYDTEGSRGFETPRVLDSADVHSDFRVARGLLGRLNPDYAVSDHRAICLCASAKL